MKHNLNNLNCYGTVDNFNYFTSKNKRCVSSNKTNKYIYNNINHKANDHLFTNIENKPNIKSLYNNNDIDDENNSNNNLISKYNQNTFNYKDYNSNYNNYHNSNLSSNNLAVKVNENSISENNKKALINQIPRPQTEHKMTKWNCNNNININCIKNMTNNICNNNNNQIISIQKKSKNQSTSLNKSSKFSSANNPNSNYQEIKLTHMRHKSINKPTTSTTSKTNTMSSSLNKDKNSKKANSDNKPTQKNINDNNNNGTNNNNSIKFYLATFIDKIGSHNSFLSVILHLIYRIKLIRNYILLYKTTSNYNMNKTSANSNEDNNLKNELIEELKSIFIKYPLNKKINLSKLRLIISNNFMKSDHKNKFEIDKPNDPADFYFAVLNIIHCLYNNKPIYKTYSCDSATECNCIIHKHLYLNILKYDQCECNSSKKSFCSNTLCIIDIPIDKVLKLSLSTYDKMYYSKEKLFDLFSSLIKNNSNIQCPLNGKNCNYNRTKRTLKLLNKICPSFLVFSYDVNSNDIHNNSNNSNTNFQYNLSELFNSLIIIPDSLDIESLFEMKGEDNNFIKPYEFRGCIFKKQNNIFTCAFKNDIQKNNKNIWTYYDDENLLNFYGWIDVISFCLKNFLIPYLLIYQVRDLNDKNLREYSIQTINKEEYKIIDKYIKSCKDFQICNNINCIRYNREDKLICNKEKNHNKSSHNNELNKLKSYGFNLINNDFDIKEKMFSSSNNPFKRDKSKSSSITCTSYNKI